MLTTRPLRTFLRERRSTAALEFGLCLPILVLVLFGVYDISKAVYFYQEVYNAARDMPSSASLISIQPSNNTQLTYEQVQLVESELWGNVPVLRSGGQGSGVKSITLSSITYELNAGCTPTTAHQCSYTPTVVWSVAYTGANAPGQSFVDDSTVLRSCTKTIAGAPYPGALTQSNAGSVSNSNLGNLNTAAIAAPDPNLVPPTPVIAVDVHVQYIPLFGVISTVPINFWITSFWPVRSVQTSYITTSAGKQTVTNYTLSQQFTQLENDTNDPIPASAPTNSYCINAYITNPAATM